MIKADLHRFFVFFFCFSVFSWGGANYLSTGNLQFNTLTDESGKLQVITDDPAMGQDFLRWMGLLIKQTENIISDKLDLSKSKFVLSCIKATNVAGRIESKIIYKNDENSYFLRFINPLQIKKIDAERSFVTMIITSWLDTIDEDGKFPTNDIPVWLINGILQNFSQLRKIYNSDLLLESWENGLVPAISLFISGRAGTDKNAIEDEMFNNAIAGLFIKWITSFPNSTVLFQKIRMGIIEGKAKDPDWFAISVFNKESCSDMNDAWDRWMLKQKQMIYRPGYLSTYTLRHLKKLLVLRIGMDGIPDSEEIPEGASFEWLIGKREESWIPVFVSSRVMALKLVAIGRGKEIEEAVNAYCCFLNSLNSKKSEKILRKYLEMGNNLSLIHI